MREEAKNYFYCYDKKFAQYLKSCGFDYITLARNRYDNRLFTLWSKTAEFEKVLLEYSK